jgi:hypothetical protein
MGNIQRKNVKKRVKIHKNNFFLNLKKALKPQKNHLKWAFTLKYGLKWPNYLRSPWWLKTGVQEHPATAAKFARCRRKVGLLLHADGLGDGRRPGAVAVQRRQGHHAELVVAVGAQVLD